MITSLFQPSRIKSLELKNRFVRSATAEAMSTDDGRPTQALKELYCRLADGEVGLIITSGACIEQWANYPHTLGMKSPLFMFDDSYIAPWRDIIPAVHERGSKIAMQIGHLGRQDIPALRNAPALAPSPVPIPGVSPEPREMTVPEIKDVVEKFGQASRRVKEAGFDAVQFHGAHGNLINNFMSPFTNRRTDDYGGSIANRARFTVEAVQRTRQLVGPDFPVMIKMNFNDFFQGGLEPGYAVAIAEVLEKAGIDCIEISGGTLSETKEHIAVKGIVKEESESYFRPYANALKQKVTIPVMLVGGHRSPGLMAQIIESNDADFISLCRPLIREPELIKRWKNGDLAKAKCISCNQCFDNWVFHSLRCFVDEPLP